MRPWSTCVCVSRQNRRVLSKESTEKNKKAKGRANQTDLKYKYNQISTGSQGFKIDGIFPDLRNARLKPSV